MGREYSSVTEVPGNQITAEALSMMWTRYAYAAELASGKDVLEVACGAGQGLGCLAGKARKVVGGDYTQALLQSARAHYGRMPLLRLDAQVLPFKESTFDVVILYEALYYLQDLQAFLAECRRVLRDAGFLVVCTVNPEWSDFNPSPFSVRYFSAAQLRLLFEREGFRVETYAAFPVEHKSVRDQFVSLLKRSAIALRLIPKTMKGKAWLKRLFLGKLTPMPAELSDRVATAAALVPIDGCSVVSDFKVIYAVGWAKR